MWSDNDIDNAFQRLNPPEPEPTPFPLDAWLRLEDQLDKAVIERAVRRRLWQFFAAEVAIVALIALGWLAWPTVASKTKLAGTGPQASMAAPASAQAATTKTRSVASSNQPESNPAAEAKAPTVAAAAPATPATSVSASVAASGPAADASIPAASGQKSAAVQPAVAALTPTRKHPIAGSLAASRLATASVADRKPAGLTAMPLSHEGGANRPAARARQAARSATSMTATSRPGPGHSTNNPSSARHPAAGSMAAPAEAPTGAVVAATASRSRPTRKRQSPFSAAAADAGLTALSAATPGSAATTAIHQNEATTGTLATTAAAGFSAPSAALPTGLADLTPTNTNLLLPATAGLPAPLTTVAEKPSTLPVPVRQPRFYVGLVAAPDVTTVRFASVEKPMPNLGVMLEYRITNRLRVNTGLLRSTKSYMARRDDYDWGAYSKQVYSHDFSDVDGTCTVLDIPLNLRYDLLAQPQYRVFGSAGLSSFFMQREHYYYDWTDANGLHAWNGYAVNQNQHLFSILNLSAGYERSLGHHLSVQAEPYVKVPLGGVGLGKVRLTSAGVFFGVKYGF